MGSATIAFVLAVAAVLLLGLGRALPNADFIYMCAAADVFGSGVLPVTPYFPSGYPLLLWAFMQTGLSALGSGMLLSAIGAGLASGAVALMARHWALPPAVAVGLGMLGLSLPSMFEISFNPHLDALYTGIALVLLATSLCALERRPAAWMIVLAATCALLLLTLRWHAVLVVLPIALTLTLWRGGRTRGMGLALLVTLALTLGWQYWALYVTEGKFELAFARQITVGHAIRELGREEANAQIYTDYASWLSRASFEPEMISEGIASNFLVFISRRAIIVGAAVCLLGMIAARSVPAGALVLLAFIIGYALSVSPAYFTPRASALPELCGVLLAASGLSLLIDWHKKASAPRLVNLRVDPALAGMVVFALLLIGIVYNGWRETALLAQWGRRRTAQHTVSERARQYSGYGDPRSVYGAVDLCDLSHSGMPVATHSRLWMDDPDVWPLIYRQVAKYAPEDVALRRTPVNAVILWPGLGNPREEELAALFAGAPNWVEADSGVPEARLFEWRSPQSVGRNSHSGATIPAPASEP